MYVVLILSLGVLVVVMALRVICLTIVYGVGLVVVGNSSFDAVVYDVV